MASYTTEEFINKAKLIHGDKYDYSLVNYINSCIKVKIICKIHGEFEQIPSDHLSGKGCYKCYGSVKLTTEEFIKKAKLAHGDKYDYSLTNYINNRTKVKIICPIRGEFEQLPRDHLFGRNYTKIADDHFFKRAKKVHGEKYNYSLVNYVNSHTKVKIICPIHGEFEQTPLNHYKKGCKKCSNNNKPTIEEFIKRAKKVHGNKYNYSLVEYKNSHSHVSIICEKHGVFRQSPTNHISNRRGCPKCTTISKGHLEIINFIKNVCNNSILINSRKIIKPYELDIYIPEHKLAIEYHGLYWHSGQQHQHYDKASLCSYKKINLLQIFEDEWINNKDDMKSIILYKLGIGSDNIFKKYSYNIIGDQLIINRRFQNFIMNIPGYKFDELLDQRCYYVNNKTRYCEVLNKHDSIVWDAGYLKFIKSK